MLTQEVISMLWCPTCQDGGLRPSDTTSPRGQMNEGELLCGSCDNSYPVRHGVPALLPHGSLATEEWKLWREHLDKFQARREDRIRNPDRKVSRWAKASRPQQPFAEFTGIMEGALLDVGCGPGKFRFNFDEESVSYVGMDPIALADVSEFPFIRGLAEYIPFQNDAFTDVVVLAALDHFRDRDGFFREARRVIRPGGKLHILQSVHEVRGPVSAIKVAGHKIKDALEDRTTRDRNPDAPKHLEEFTTGSLLDLAKRYFEVTSVERYSSRWYSPVKMFLSMTPKASHE